MNPSTKRVWLIANGHTDTIKGHCKRLGVKYTWLQSSIRREYGMKLSEAPDELLSDYLGVTIKRTTQPKDWQDIIYGEGRSALGMRKGRQQINPPRPIMLKAS